MHSKHTPGPWWSCAGLTPGSFVICCESSGFAALAKVKGDKRSTLKNAKANAQLMAAAPELLNALLAMAQHCYDTDRNDDIAKAFDLAQAAVVKAIGGV